VRRFGQAVAAFLVVASGVAALSPADVAHAVPRAGASRCSTTARSSGVTVATDRGAVQGTTTGGVTGWRGIPFAAPPIGPLRWAAPELAACWKGVRATQVFGPPCPQLDNGTVIGSEDCLTLNVWKPTKRAAPRPVMVFVHGGGNVQGSASNVVAGVTLYDGANLARTGDVVVVTVQYRVGALGYLADPALAQGTTAAGNYGLLDQIAALQWVQRNAAAFGGDPKRVLLFGESAGAVNTCMLVASPLARGRFSRALMESGACGASDKATAERTAGDFAQTAGCTGADVASCLRALPASTVVQTLPGVVELTSLGHPRYGPYVDGRVLPEDPLTRIESGKANRVPMIIGSNADETAIFVRNVQTPEEYRAAVAAMVAPATAAQILALYPVDQYGSGRAAMIAVTTDALFTCTARRTVRAAVTGQGTSVYRYFFTHTMAGGTLRALGAFHGLDLFFVFGRLDTTGYTPTVDEQALSVAMMRSWAQFAATGDPKTRVSGTGTPAWPRAKAGADPYLQLDTPITSGDGVRTEQCNFWDSLSR
jgi:para-nitrobenzyl esterase